MPFLGRVTVPAKPSSFAIFFSKDELAELHDRYGVNEHSARLLILSWVSLLADSPSSYMKPRRLYVAFKKRLISDLRGTIKMLSRLSDALAETLVHTDSGASIARFLDEFKGTPIFWEYHKFTRTLDADLLRYIQSFLLFGKKLFYVDSELDAIALRDWLEVERRLHELSLNPDIIKHLRAVMRVIFDDWEMLPFLPKHGSGAVSETGIYGSNQKNHDMPTHPRYERMLKWCGTSEVRIHPESGRFSEGRVSIDRSRLKFVPKDIGKTRSICMEPVLFQYAQQGVRLGYEHHLSKSVLNRFVNIHDQSLNQDGALFGSEFGLVDTIDLSSASDSVSWELTKSIFPAKVCKYLAATRTSLVTIPNEDAPVRVKKFAPMGSALCFPVQSTIYSAIVILATYMRKKRLGIADLSDAHPIRSRNEVEGLFYRRFGFLSQKAQPFRVYGDDIVCDQRDTDMVVALLRLLGFTVNSEKSYTADSAFRESCGVHAFDGSDVTPLRYKVKFVSRKIRIEVLEGIIDLCNRANSYGYLHLRRFLKNVALYYPVLNVKQGSNGVNPILFSSNEDDTTSIQCDSPRNNHLKKRLFTGARTNDTRGWYQRDEVQSITVTTKDKDSVEEKFDNYHYLVWQRSRISGLENTDFEISYRKYVTRGTRVRRRWTPA